MARLKKFKHTSNKDVYSASTSPSLGSNLDSNVSQNKVIGLQNYSSPEQKNATIDRASLLSIGTNYKLNSSFDPDFFANVTASDLSGRTDTRDNLVDWKLHQNSELHWIKRDLAFPDKTALLGSSAFRRTSNRALDNQDQTAKFLRWLKSGSSLNFSQDISAPGAFLKRSRRQVQQDEPKDVEVLRKKAFEMMLQSMYSAQERLWPLESIVKKYEHLTPYRMAFIFMKLDQLVQESHAIYKYLQRMATDMKMTMLRRIQMHSQLARRNIDVTYLVDYVTQRVPRDQIVRFRQWIIRKEQEALLQYKARPERA